MSERMSAKFRLWEVIMLLLVALAIFLLVTLFTYSAADPGWGASSSAVANAGGRIGAWCAYTLFAFFGYFGYLFPFLMLYGILVSYLDRKESIEHSKAIIALRCAGAVLIFISGSGLASLWFHTIGAALPYGPGGMLGNWINVDLMPLLNYVGSMIVLIAVFLIGLTLFSGVSWIRFTLFLLRGIWRSFVFVGKGASKVSKKKCETRRIAREKKHVAKALATSVKPEITEAQPIIPTNKLTKPAVEDVVNTKAGLALVDVKHAGSVIPDTDTIADAKINPKMSVGDIPGLDLLDEPKSSQNQVSKQQLEQTAALVEQRLQDFSIQAKVVGACPGPIVTRFELELAPGVKVSKLSGLSKDLARSLAAHSVRIVEVIPGKSVVGLEIPNDKRDIVCLKEVLDTKAFHKLDSPLAMGLGKDIAGEPEVVNLAKMPHLLVAGTTGSGKSVGVNAMILSMLFKATPEDLRMIMIDPKMLELSVYEGIPHLLTPVVTDMKEAASALRWCVREMDRRYKVMSIAGVRNIIGMNEKIRAAKKSGKPLKDEVWLQNNPGAKQADCPELESMPYIVVIVDEFADMMMVVGKKVEELIARLAQKARAAGIHLILATQRPSVDVITGLIKANIPCRISFQVSSKIDSRTVLDQMGAEQLLGYGDMLYLPSGTSVPTRVHGAFVADREVHAVASAWKARGQPEYIDSILTIDSDGEGGNVGESEGGEKDALYDQAVQIVIETQRASISSVQRRLRIGYNRAARLLEDMEAAGIVSEIQSNGMREILVGNQ